VGESMGYMVGRNFANPWIIKLEKAKLDKKILFIEGREGNRVLKVC
jgi:hypothetical protein